MHGQTYRGSPGFWVEVVKQKPGLWSRSKQSSIPAACRVRTPLPGVVI